MVGSGGFVLAGVVAGVVGGVVGVVAGVVAGVGGVVRGAVDGVVRAVEAGAVVLRVVPWVDAVVFVVGLVEFEPDVLLVPFSESASSASVVDVDSSVVVVVPSRMLVLVDDTADDVEVDASSAGMLMIDVAVAPVDVVELAASSPLEPHPESSSANMATAANAA
ncbi:MAG: hypothetical protein KDB86_06050 [Actinobacteria bacterium]|nr:hypothetical protein [Actinomycetota bacterium]MCB9389787.1 hypothetical protein [Acidimicrobiia bacterium]